MYIAADFGIEGDSTVFRTPLESMVAMFVISMGEFADLYAQLDNIKYSAIGKV
jgi:hypothetical protein